MKDCVLCATAAIGLLASFVECRNLGLMVGPAPTVPLASGAALPMVVLGTGSGQKGNVTDAVRLWLGETAGVGLDCAYDCMYHVVSPVNA